MCIFSRQTGRGRFPSGPVPFLPVERRAWGHVEQKPIGPLYSWPCYNFWPCYNRCCIPRGQVPIKARRAAPGLAVLQKCTSPSRTVARDFWEQSAPGAVGMSGPIGGETGTRGSPSGTPRRAASPIGTQETRGRRLIGRAAPSSTGDRGAGAVGPSADGHQGKRIERAG